jgi:NAD(P)-dependent dehydrogenase (short-subunit alcohol dehydrogenase family)
VCDRRREYATGRHDHSEDRGASSRPSSEQRAFAAFQGGVASLTASLALELAQRGIRVNAVQPGPVWAPRLLRTLTDEQRLNFGA